MLCVGGGGGEGGWEVVGVGGRSITKLFWFYSEKRSTRQGKYLLPLGANSVLIE